MNNLDPLANIESVVRDINGQAERYTKPARRRYPFLFALLLTFAAASIFQGFEIFVNQTPFLREHPLLLIGGGLFLLAVTGGLYRVLTKP